MDGFEINKIIAAVLIALLTAKVADIAGDRFVHQEKKLHQQAFVIEGVAQSATASAGDSQPKGPEDIKPLLAAADLANGEKIFKKCAVCHTIEKGEPAKVGPNLWGVINGPKDHMPGFAYSEAMKTKGGTWTYDDLSEFLYKPQAFVKGTKMSFAGLSNTKERADVIAYLRSKSDSPAELPK
ncbi:Cytochrome c family protein [Candidatus Bealeia paramacronuclearis]|uniref:Cytochrome c family protein n=1 Tax=Candidatus Bealeia paramacronuclearis TaxID=1921001 RepID=A0ABZ2C038_9PROT|nr:Cytochrome c family protein [Candidatus Bealeia paramacronuclearis]